MKRLLMIVLIAFLAMAAVLGVLRLTVSLFGSWWRFEGAPTAEEWSAFFGAFVVGGLVIAWFQLRQVDRSNRELASSNDDVRRVNLELVRPRIIVDLEYQRALFKSRHGQLSGSIMVIVSNGGASTASDVRLSLTPGFQSLEQFFKPGKMEEYLSEVNAKFQGAVLFPQLAAGVRHGYFLGRFPDLTEDATGLPRRYIVKVQYNDVSRKHQFEESFVLDLDVNRSIEISADPVARLGKDVEVVGDELKLIRQGLTSVTRAQNKQADALGNLVSGQRPVVGKPSRPREHTRWTGRR
ncbi:hypothetical protein KK103_06825 [Curtobacterium flaccumfaciens pv. flaccumfaciens]|uniref:Uncharacterized protein n=1 Tax=Curtobacterium flaccumfaciens pv. flaccumfaciens TaxID=138532 RepID=A0A9Q2W5Q3_9MICO|nr:hypothetical protein [Curtobacterium flaccumfaciens]MBT1541470.1 hypothetical protein [Curtobacterium flaccumfaciens pv. flaccumfaciens]